jgi:hypothetical protein
VNLQPRLGGGPRNLLALRRRAKAAKSRRPRRRGRHTPSPRRLRGWALGLNPKGIARRPTELTRPRRTTPSRGSPVLTTSEPSSGSSRWPRPTDATLSLRLLMERPALTAAARLIQTTAQEMDVEPDEAKLWDGRLRWRYPAAAHALLGRAGRWRSGAGVQCPGSTDGGGPGHQTIINARSSSGWTRPAPLCERRLCPAQRERR